MSSRLFVALDLPEPARAALVAFRTAVADPALWRPVPDEALHLTLAFLGHRPEADVERIAALLKGAPVNAPRLTLGRALGLPLKRPRVLTAAIVDHDGTLTGLQRWVSRELAAAGSTGRRSASSARTRRWRGCGRTPRWRAGRCPGRAGHLLRRGADPLPLAAAAGGRAL